MVVELLDITTNTRINNNSQKKTKLSVCTSVNIVPSNHGHISYMYVYQVKYYRITKRSRHERKMCVMRVSVYVCVPQRTWTAH